MGYPSPKYMHMLAHMQQKLSFTFCLSFSMILWSSGDDFTQIFATEIAKLMLQQQFCLLHTVQFITLATEIP